MSASTETVPGRRPGFKLPAPLSMVEEPDRNVWSPNRHSSSIVANGEFRSMSPRTPTAALATQACHGSGSSSPKAGTPTRFEDPLLLRREPAVRRNSSGSPTTDPAYPGPMSPSPSFRATASFTARRTSIGLDFRRSVPGAANGGGSPAEPQSSRALQDHSLAQRGASEHGDLDYGGVNGQQGAPYASSLAGSESGAFGCDEDDTTDTDLDGSLSALPRRHSTIPAKEPHSTTAAAPRLVRAAEDDEFSQRLLSSRSSWRARAASVTTLGGSGGGGGEGLQTKTHAALQQLRGEFKSLSLKSMPQQQQQQHQGAQSAGGAAAAPPSAFAGGGHFSGPAPAPAPAPAGANVTAGAVSHGGAGAGGSHGGAGGNSSGNGNSGSVGAGVGVVAHVGLVSPGSTPSSLGGGCGGGGSVVGAFGGAGGGGAVHPASRLGDCHQQAQQSPSRLSVSTRSSSGLGDELQPQQPPRGGLPPHSPLRTAHA